MARFRVKIQNSQDQIEEKEVEASDKSSLFASLKNEGLTPISFEIIDSNGLAGINFQALNEKFSSVRERDKIVFAQNLGAMIEAGLSVSRAVFVIKSQTKNAKLKRILNDIEDNLKKGSALSQALSKHPKIFTQLFVSMVKAGEESGSLSDVLKIIASQMEKTYLLKKKIKGAMMYPGIILSAVFIIGFLMMTFVVPTLTETFKELDVDLPVSTQIIIAISDFMKNHTIIFLAIIIALIVSIYSYLKTKQGKRHFQFLLLHTPLVSNLVKETNAARTARTLSSLLSAGVEVIHSLSITREVLQNAYYKDVLKEAEERVQKGTQLSLIFKEYENIYPIFVSEMTSVGEETGKLPDMLLRVALFYEEDIDQKTKNMSTIIEPFLMILIGAVVGFFALSMITPTYSLIDGL